MFMASGNHYEISGADALFAVFILVKISTFYD